MVFGGIEAGGTEFVCAVGTGPHDVIVSDPFPTTTPQETLGRVIAFFQGQGPLDAIGIGAFGPLDLHPDSPTYGYITNTPKPHWANADFVGPIRAAFDVPIGFDTDVNAAALGEYHWGAGQGLHTFIYLTIGTGIGGGAMAAGNLVHGLVHTEMGHILLPHDPARDPFPGRCAYHGHCLEGLAAGPAIEARWGLPAKQLPPDHEAWALEAHYLALGLEAMIMVLSPQRIIMGGGVMRQTQLFPMIRQELKRLLNDYVLHPLLLEKLDEYIVPPALDDHAGVMGAIALAQSAWQKAGR